MNDLIIVNHAGRRFGIRYLDTGTPYGVDDKLTWDSRPAVEIYDYTYHQDPRFGPRGQFVSRYHLDTLHENRRQNTTHYGLNLDGGVNVWTLDYECVTQILRYADTLHPR